MAHSHIGCNTLLLAESFFVLTVLAGFSASPAVSFPRPLYECKPRGTTPIATLCEDLHKQWVQWTKKLQCEGRYKDSGKPTKAEFATILQSHAEWLAAYAAEQPPVSTGYGSKKAQQDPRRVNLCGADLRDIELQGIDLRGADLQGVNLAGKHNYKNLTGINLEGANLTGANMMRTVLKGANLKTIYLHDADLCGTDLQRAQLVALVHVNISRAFIADTGQFHIGPYAHLCGSALVRVDLRGLTITQSILNHAGLSVVDLENATLEHVNLHGVSLESVNLRNARLIDVNLSQVSFPKPPTLDGLLLLGVKGLSSITFENPSVLVPLVTLRKALKESGLTSQEKAVISAMRKFALKTTEPVYVRFVVHWLLGGWITDYGAQPWWSLLFLLAAIPLFSLLYMVALNSRFSPGIWAVWLPDRVHKHFGEEGHVRLTLETPFPLSQPVVSRCTELCTTETIGSCSLCEALAERDRFCRGSTPRLTLYFSLLSAFHIGWRDLNVGTWLSRIQPREYTLRATGWVRVVSGIQSLLSVYLLALWALTYFGRPFE